LPADTRQRSVSDAGVSWWVLADCKATLHVALLRTQKGLELIASSAAGGYFILPSEAYLQKLYHDPGFAPILAKQEARQARERKRFLAIVCTDNLGAVWQPAEETCERFAAEDGN